jgi:uncharacterized protein YjfI (DUF2170 family)
MNMIKVETRIGPHVINPSYIVTIRPVETDECRVTMKDYGDLFIKMSAEKLLQIIEGMR